MPLYIPHIYKRRRKYVEKGQDNEYLKKIDPTKNEKTKKPIETEKDKEVEK